MALDLLPKEGLHGEIPRCRNRPRGCLSACVSQLDARFKGRRTSCGAELAFHWRDYDHTDGEVARPEVKIAHPNAKTIARLTNNSQDVNLGLHPGQGGSSAGTSWRPRTHPKLPRPLPCRGRFFSMAEKLRRINQSAQVYPNSVLKKYSSESARSAQGNGM